MSSQWQLYKTLNAHGIGISKVEIAMLDQLTQMYQVAQKKDPYIGVPLLAYYPAERLCHEINLTNKNNPLTFQPTHAYDIAPIPFTAFSKFFEWLREVNDIENAAIAAAVKSIVQNHPKNQHGASNLFAQQISQAYQQLQHPHFHVLQQTIQAVLPDIEDIYLQHQPKLQLTILSQQKKYAFQQLSSSLKMQICLIGDIVRRLCVLNPKSINPCQEGEGVLMIDAIDQHLDTQDAAIFLNRLHLAFPRLQIIVSSQCQDILDFSQNWHCCSVSKKGVHTINFKNDDTHFNELYSHLDALPPNTSLDPIETINSPHHLEEWRGLLQSKLDPEQQRILGEQLMQTSNHPSVDSLK